MANAEMSHEDLKGLIRLDKKKDYGQVFPPEDGAHYDQGGFLFDHKGELCAHLLNHEQRNKLQAMSMKKQADAIAEKARQDYFAKQGIEGDKIAELSKIDAPPAPPAAGGGEEGKINLVGWAMKQIAVPWPKVRDAAMKEYSLGSLKSADELRQWMVDQGMIPASVLDNE